MINIKEAFDKAASSDFVKETASIISGVKVAISDKIGEAFPKVKEFWDKLKDKVNEKLHGDEKDDSKPNDKDSKDPSFDETRFHEDMSAILSDDKKSDVLMKATVAGTVAAYQLKEEGKSPDDITKISSAVSQYTANVETCSLQYQNATARDEAIKNQLQIVAGETGIDATTIQKAYEESVNETNACVEIAEKAASDQSFDKSQLSKHPALNALLDENGRNKAFDADSVDLDEIGKTSAYYDKNNDVYNTVTDDMRMYALMKGAAPVITQQVVQSSVVAEMQNDRLMEAAASGAGVDYEASTGVEID